MQHCGRGRATFYRDWAQRSAGGGLGKVVALYLICLKHFLLWIGLDWTGLNRAGWLALGLGWPLLNGENEEKQEMREGGHPLRGVICDFLRNSHRVFLFKIVDFPFVFCVFISLKLHLLCSFTIPFWL